MAALPVPQPSAHFSSPEPEDVDVAVTEVDPLAGDADGLGEDENLEQASPPPHPSLREISALAAWTVSTYKPGCGVAALLHPSTAHFWQSDGPQPHRLTAHFFKRVRVRRLRVHVDFARDESYTPTRMAFAAGTGEYDLVEFAEWRGEAPTGWVEVDLRGCGGGRRGGARMRGMVVWGGAEDGAEEEEEREEEEDDGLEGHGVLSCMCVQIRVLENHQNGKDTHIRGVQLFAQDETAAKAWRKGRRKEEANALEGELDALDLSEPDWMGEPEIR